MNLTPFVLDAARGALILGVALASLRLARRAPASIRRALLITALVSVLVSPLATRTFAATSAAQVVALPFFVREIHFDPAVEPIDAPPAVDGAMDRGATNETAVPAKARVPFMAWSTLLMAVWALGAAVVVGRLGLGIRRAHKLVRDASRDGLSHFEGVMRAVASETGLRAAIAISDDIDAPVVAGIFRAVVVMPRAALAWSEQRWRFVLLHELAHVGRRDCLASVLAELACAVHWFDPLVWLARSRLRRERELAADEDVIATGSLASDYAGHLIAIATASQRKVAGALGMTAKRSELALRVETLVARERPPKSSRAAMAGIVCAGSATALAVACANPQPAAPGPMAHEATVAPQNATASSSAMPPIQEVTPLLDEVAKQIGMPASRIELTIDPPLQKIVDEELAHLVAEHHPAAATAIVLDPNSGELLALGDPSTARRAFVTGSTIKPITVAAALETGSVRPDQKLDCRPRQIGARTIEDPKLQGQLDLAGIIEVSSNVGASRIFDAVGKDRFDEVLARFHLGDVSTVQLPGMARGEVPKTANLDAYDGAMVAIGEGLSATPLQMVAAYGAFANQGEYVAPTLVRKVTDAAGRAASPRAAARERVVRAETAQTMLQMLERAVNGPQGTGKRAKVQGVRVAGKTGTAGFTTVDGKDHIYASFIGIVPADAPRFVILVGAFDPSENGWGPVVAAPAFAKIAARALSSR